MDVGFMCSFFKVKTDTLNMLTMEDEYEWIQESPPKRSQEEQAQKTTRQGKLLRLDDLLADEAKENNRKLDREAKKRKLVDSDSSEDDDADTTTKKAYIDTLLQECEKQVCIDDGLEISKWGEPIFGPQKRAPVVVVDDSSGLSKLLSAGHVLSMRSEGDPLPKDGERLFLELLRENWLLPFIQSCGIADTTIFKWAFSKMAYTRDQEIEKAALKFLSNNFGLQAQQESSYPSYLPWFPSLNLVLEALYVYGYLDTYPDLSSTTNFGDLTEGHLETLEIDGPPRNLQSLLQLLISSCENRRWRTVLSVSNVELLSFLISRMWLDRRILFLSSIVQACVEALIDLFTEDEWPTSCERLSTLISRESKRKLNILYVLRCLCGAHPRFHSLRKAIATKLLITVPSCQGCSSIEDVVNNFGSVDLKSEDLDFFDVYYRIVLADICMWSDTSLSKNQNLLDTWLYFLKCCSVRVSSSNFRPYATKVRNKASYLWHNYMNCWKEGSDVVSLTSEDSLEE